MCPIFVKFVTRWWKFYDETVEVLCSFCDFLLGQLMVFPMPGMRRAARDKSLARGHSPYKTKSGLIAFAQIEKTPQLRCPKIFLHSVI